MAKSKSALQQAHDKLMRKGNRKEKGGGTRKYGRNEAKCKRYRQRIGKPRGPMVDGCKSGRRSVA